jgi:hypothetical protein
MMEKISIVIVTVAAILQIVESKFARRILVRIGPARLRSLPMPTSRRWPSLVLFVATVLLNIHGCNQARQQKFAWHETPRGELKRVVRQNFMNEVVLLDGMSYEDCSFDHVTFSYNGTTGFEFRHNKVNGPSKIDSNNPSIEGTVVFLIKGLGFKMDMISRDIDLGPTLTPVAIPEATRTQF